MERKLVEQAMHGDEAAFDALIGRVGDQLHSVARRILRGTWPAGHPDDGLPADITERGRQGRRHGPDTPCRRSDRAPDDPRFDPPHRRAVVTLTLGESQVTGRIARPIAGLPAHER
jgi:hypothetical protein